MKVMAVYHLRCDHCGGEVTQTYYLADFRMRVKVLLPEGWCQVGERLFCAQHTVAVVVDEERLSVHGGQLVLEGV